MKAITLLAILSIVGSCYAALPIVTCKSTNDLKVNEISLSNSTWTCEKEPCVVYKGLNVSITISFENVGATDITTLTNDVYGIFLGITVPYPKFPPEMKNVCILGDSSSSCPIKKGDKFTEKVTVPILNAAESGMKVVAKWQLVNGSSVEGCFEAELQIM
ncbi:uncharacterized protein LOC135349195 isoform X1 [Halichondria panicea]|uniref:uncharacterized protein LOC135349195 isoform X1 n=1 Tax=Halichondria panicea TaxID=6063 RepID=UPI00312B2AF3